MLKLRTYLDVVRTLNVTEVRAHPQVREMPVLCERRRQVREGVRARKIVIAILAHESVHGKHHVRVEYVRPRRRDIKRVDQYSLVLACSRLIELIGLFEKITRLAQVKLDPDTPPAQN